MKTSSKILSSVALMAAAMGVSAGPPGVPSIYGKGPLTAPYSNPGLFTAERAAFTALESAMQVAEGVVYQGGCAAAARSYDMSTFVDQDGYGNVDVSSGGALQFRLNVAPGASTAAPVGTSYNVKGFGHLGGTTLANFSSTGRYSAGGAMMTEGATLGVRSVNGSFDNLSGFLIKDFFKFTPVCARCTSSSIPVIYDWGLQSMHKNTTPQDKWWQRSVATRSDGVVGRTIWWKDRLFSAKNGGVCHIKIDLSGTNDADLFAQDGTISISRIAPPLIP